MEKENPTLDVQTYRQKPCLTYVATGSCPFGVRCDHIHDPRVTGESKSWLTHTETQGNNMNTDINVESLYQKRINELIYGTPFGAHFSIETFSMVRGQNDELCEQLYKLITNQSANVYTRQQQRRRTEKFLSSIHKIDIALQMIGDRHDWSYKFCPNCIIYNEQCMVLQKKTFRLHKDGQAEEIPPHEYRPYSNHDIIVREIAFGM